MSTASSENAAERRRALYDRGFTISFACRADPRFSYCLFVPEDLGEAGEPDLLVAVHGTGRAQEEYRNTFGEFGRYNNCVILAPLFPAGVRGDDERDGYKYILEGDIRYDEIVLSMVKEVEERLAVSFPKFMMFGFSGGGHFTHRFLYLHPERLKAVSIGSPGSITLLDDSRDWWVGIRNMKEMFGKSVDFDALRKVAVHLIVGGADTEGWEITHKPGGARWMEGCNDAGKTRIERNTTLKKSLESHGVTVKQEIVPNVAHSMRGVALHVKTFFLGVLKGKQDKTGKAA
ncbi:alpha/beta hydrolase [uncultured Nisaea sp.]|jgi:pimeloyl-ACP methyl ester carboxylesterase|uniref:alpha/beta hydrolase n=1 Tax=uncultured Nisaea sp. TaxID=538215 RepID=UPI0030EBBE6D|tara:strand:- start:2832 stop:3698 length:867 start_codon:yes stop_codon:yes gene_type:complete